MADDIYNGYFIPKNSTIIGNTWFVIDSDALDDYSFISRAILHDSMRYKEPESFLPERYDDPNVPDPLELGVFGYGRT